MGNHGRRVSVGRRWIISGQGDEKTVKASGRLQCALDHEGVFPHSGHVFIYPYSSGSEPGSTPQSTEVVPTPPLLDIFFAHAWG